MDPRGRSRHAFSPPPARAPYPQQLHPADPSPLRASSITPPLQSQTQDATDPTLLFKKLGHFDEIRNALFDEFMSTLQLEDYKKFAFKFVEDYVRKERWDGKDEVQTRSKVVSALERSVGSSPPLSPHLFMLSLVLHRTREHRDLSRLIQSSKFLGSEEWISKIDTTLETIQNNEQDKKESSMQEKMNMEMEKVIKLEEEENTVKVDSTPTSLKDVAVVNSIVDSAQ